MKAILLFPICLGMFLINLFGCASSQHIIPTELPGNLKGYYIECENEFSCGIRSVNICKNGYWVASTVTNNKIQVGNIIVCYK